MSDEGQPTSGVYEKMRVVMQQVGRVPKNGYNAFHKYEYVLEADLMDALRPLMAEIGLLLLVHQTDCRTDRSVKTKRGEDNVATIHHIATFIDVDDGSSVSFGVWGEGQDSGDKGSYKAFTGAMKYALMKAMMVSTGDDPEHAHAGEEPPSYSASDVTPPPPEKVQELTNLFMPIEEHLTRPEREAVAAAMRGERNIDSCISWLGTRIEQINSAHAEREA